MRNRKTHIILEETPKYLTGCWFPAAFSICCSAGGTHSSVGEETWEQVVSEQSWPSTCISWVERWLLKGEKIEEGFILSIWILSFYDQDFSIPSFEMGFVKISQIILLIVWNAALVYDTSHSMRYCTGAVSKIMRSLLVDLMAIKMV